MIGLPNQTLAEVQDSIEEIVSMEPEHISVYSLILEEGTPLFKKGGRRTRTTRRRTRKENVLDCKTNFRGKWI